MHNYKIKYSKKRKKSIALSINNNCEVIVKAPMHVSSQQIDDFVKSKSRWLNTKIKLIKNSQLPKNTCLYLGKKYQVEQLFGYSESIEIIENKIIIKNPRINNQFSANTTLSLWLKKQAIEYVETRSLELFEIFNVYGLSTPKIGFKKTKSRWGECRSDGVINFNYSLIKTASECIDYVIIHEFCHLIEPNHGKKFYALLNKHLPDWKTYKKQLNQYTYMAID